MYIYLCFLLTRKDRKPQGKLRKQQAEPNSAVASLRCIAGPARNEAERGIIDIATAA